MADKQPGTASQSRGLGRPFQKGESGNPKGRPPSGESFAEALREVATPKEKKAVAKAMLKAAKDGSIAAATFVRDTLDGRPMQRLEHSGDEEAPIPITLQLGKKGPAKTPKEMTDEELEKAEEALGGDGDDEA